MKVAVSIVVDMKARDLLRLLKSRGCVEVRQKGSHLTVRCGACTTVVPVHAGQDIGRGLLASIERSLARCLGEKWLKGAM